MYRRDLLTAEIQKLGQALSRLMGLKNDGKEEEADNGLQEVLEQDFGILYADLIACDGADFTAFLQEKNFTSEKLDIFSQLLYLKFSPVERNEESDSIAEKLQLIYQDLEVKHRVINMINLGRQKTITQYLRS